jgi:hypothetical protein
MRGPLGSSLSMIFSENRCALFGIMLQGRRDESIRLSIDFAVVPLGPGSPPGARESGVRMTEADWVAKLPTGHVEVQS